MKDGRPFFYKFYITMQIVCFCNFTFKKMSFHTLKKMLAYRNLQFLHANQIFSFFVVLKKVKVISIIKKNNTNNTKNQDAKMGGPKPRIYSRCNDGANLFLFNYLQVNVVLEKLRKDETINRKWLFFMVDEKAGLSHMIY
jgi:hypothetical protein